MAGAIHNETAAKLSERERQCLRLVFDRLRPKEIGRELGISYHTVNGHLQQAMRKLGATSSIEAARLLFGSGQPPRDTTPESVTGYDFGVELPLDSSSLVPSDRGGSPYDRVQDSVFQGKWPADAAPFAPHRRWYRFSLPSEGEKRNDLSQFERLAWITIGMFLIAIFAFVGAATIESIQRTLQSIVYHST